MSSEHQSLEAHSRDRKARLAHLRSLKRKQPHDGDNEDDTNGGSEDLAKQDSQSKAKSSERTVPYLSGRNYDPETRMPRLGFENNPNAGKETIETQAKKISDETKAEAKKNEEDDAPTDLFKIQPKKPNWDLKRELEKKLEVLNVRTENAMAKMVRERIEKQKQAEKLKRDKQTAAGDAQDEDEGEAIGMDGATLLEATRELEREEAAAQEHEDAQDLT